jgi:integrase
MTIQMLAYRIRTKKIYRSDRREYYIVIKAADGQLYERVLKNEEGKSIVASPNATITNNGKKIENESLDTYAVVMDAVVHLVSKLNDEGTFSKKGNLKFKDCMDKYLEYHQDFAKQHFKTRYYTKRSCEAFDAFALEDIKRANVREWIKGMVNEGLTHNSIKNNVSPAKAMFNWLIKEELWEGNNPFANHSWTAKGMENEVKATIDADEWKLIRNLVAEDKMLEQAVTIAYYTGIRPSEVYRVQPEDFDPVNLTMVVHVTKTKKQVYSRYIAVPQCLMDWVNEHEQDWAELNEFTMQHRVIKHLKSHPALSDICMASFRKNYADTMEAAGADHEYIDAHQGRYQNTTLLKHYLKNKFRAVFRMRPFVTAVFGSNAPQIVSQSITASATMT